MRTLKSFLYMQLIWFTAATAFNLLSALAVSQGHQGFAGNTPLQAQAFVIVFGLVTLTGFLRTPRVFQVAAPVVVILLALGGVGRHFTSPIEDYASLRHWYLAVGINLFGSVAYLTASIAAFRLNGTAQPHSQAPRRPNREHET